jgi:hypothetical protein
MNEREPPGFDARELEPLRFDVSRGAPPASRARVRARVDHTIASLAADVVDAAPRSEKGAPETARASGLSKRPSGLVGTLAAKPIWVAGAAFVLGAATGAGLYASVRPPVERVVYLDRPVSTPEPSTVFAPSVPLPRATSVVAEERRENTLLAPHVASRAAAPAPASSGLAAERVLLDRARIALGAGDGADAVRTLQLHARRFPNGFLVEEREALTIKIMVENGQIDEARKLGLKFRERYPKSLFGPTVDDALGTNP